MSNRIWMPLSIVDYLADTGHLSAAEHGAYLLLIMRYWQDGGLPEDERMIARYSKLDAQQWAESRDYLLSRFEPGATGYSPAERVLGLDRKRSIPRPLRREVFERDGQACRYCGTVTGPFQIDHVHPWSRGGRHTIENLRVACKPCNALKGALSAEEFIEVLQ